MKRPPYGFLRGGSVATIFFFLKAPIALPIATAPEWFAGTFLFVLTIGQCAYFGAFGNSTRRSLHQRTIELKIANRRIEELAQLDDWGAEQASHNEMSERRNGSRPAQ